MVVLDVGVAIRCDSFCTNREHQYMFLMCSASLLRPEDLRQRSIASTSCAMSMNAPNPLDAEPLPMRGRALQRLRTYFLTGMVIAGPIAITSYLTWWFVSSVDQWVKPIVPAIYLPETYLPFAIPGFGLLVAFLLLTMLGFLTANLVGRTLWQFSERLLDRTPVVRGLYKGMKQIFETVFSQSGTSFKRVGLVQYPAQGMWSVVFISAAPKDALAGSLPGGREHVGVFLPCAPNPTTGFFFYLPKEDVIEIQMAPDEAAKLVMSAGLIQPEHGQARLAALADASARKKTLSGA
jgi:uncharacterized membrane protein